VSIGGTISFTGAGTLTSTGTLTVAGSATLGTTSAFRIYSNVTVGAGNSLTNAGLVNTSGAGNLSYAGTLTNGAAGTWIENGNTRFFANSSFVNNGIWELQTVDLSNNGGVNSLVNNATLRKTGAGTANVNIPVTNNGSINVQGGTLNLNSTRYTAIPAANINVSGGASLALNSMTLDGTVNCTGTGTFLSSGTLTVSGAVTTTTTAPLQLFSNVTVTAGNSLTNQGLVSTSGAGNQSYVGPLVNGANGTWIENGNTRFFANASFVNNGVWEAQNVVYVNNGGTNAVTNNATFRKTGAGTTTFSGIPFINNAAANVLDGDVVLTSTTYTGNGSAAWNVSAPGTVTLASSTIVGTLRGTGAGSIRSTGTLSPSGNAVINTVQPFELLGGVSAGGVGNSLTNAGNLSTGGAGNLSYTGSMINTGNWVEAGNTRFFGSATLNNQGVLDVRGVSLVNNGGTNALINSGTMIKTGTGSFTTNLPITNSGIIDVREATATLNGSLTQAAAGARTLVRADATIGGAALTFAGGSVEGLGTITQAVSVSGARINPGDPIVSGTLNFGSSLTMSGSSGLQIDLGVPSSEAFDRVQATGNVVVGGTLVVNVTEPFYPILGDVYEIVRSTAAGPNARTGTFANVVVNADPGIAFAVSYTSNSVRLTVTDTTCDPIDFNRDGLFPDDADLIDFLSVLAGGSCSTDPTPGCADIDFNNDGLFPDDTDLVSFLTVLAGGGC
jgi:hypothetical protein